MMNVVGKHERNALMVNTKPNAKIVGVFLYVYMATLNHVVEPVVTVLGFVLIKYKNLNVNPVVDLVSVFMVNRKQHVRIAEVLACVLMGNRKQHVRIAEVLRTVLLMVNSKPDAKIVGTVLGCVLMGNSKQYVILVTSQNTLKTGVIPVNM